MHSKSEQHSVARAYLIRLPSFIYWPNQIVLDCSCVQLIHAFKYLLLVQSLLVYLQFVGVDSLKAGNVVQLVMVLGLTVGWISTYVLRVSTKEMTYAKQLEDYENRVIQV